LNKKQMQTLLDRGLLTTHGSGIQPDLSSLDLSLSSEAYRMIPGAVKPVGDKPYGWFIKTEHLAEQLSVEPDETFFLEAKVTYIFKLNERLENRLSEINVYGQATAKSSVGRVDVLTRLIVDGMVTYECFDPTWRKHGSGDMYLEVTPITFPVKVRPGISLSQLRFFYGRPVELQSEVLYPTIFDDPQKIDGTLNVDLQNTNVGGLPAAAFCATEPCSKGEFIPLWVTQAPPDPCKHWSLKESEKDRLTIEKENFYILRSRERIAVPPGIAVYCRASDETIGEMRIHYAGFVHPWWGLRRNDGTRGTPLIFEVRGHQVNVSLAHGERMATLTFYRMSQDAEEGELTPYESQKLQLSKFFAPWPQKLKRSADGRLEAA
jgi:dCTP deaminase